MRAAGRAAAGERAAGARGAGRDGFALIEVTLALVLIALLAALALPALVRTTGPGSLRIAGMEVSALLRDARTAALRTGRTTDAIVNRGGRVVASAATGAAVAVPPGALARAEPHDILFFADGRSTGGSLVLATARARAVVTVNPDTGAVDVHAP